MFENISVHFWNLNISHFENEVSISFQQNKCNSVISYRPVVISTFFFTIATVTSITIHCTYNNGDGWGILDGQYVCLASSFESATEKTMVDGFVGDHLSEKYDRDVKLLFMQGKSIKYMPKNIARYFPNLEGLCLYDTDVAEITREDLKPFPGLKAFYLRNSNLTTLGPNLFEFNPKLKYIDFSDNQISGIARNVFHGIEDLNVVELSGNTCISFNASNEQEILEMMRMIGEECQSEAMKALAKTLHRSKYFFAEQVFSIKESSAAQIDDLKKITTAQINELKKVIEELHQEVKRLHAS